MADTPEVLVDLVEDQTDHPYLTVRLILPEGRLLLMAGIAEERGTLVASGPHVTVEAGDIAPNSLGIARLRAIVGRLMEVFDYDHLIVEGADRTTGAGRGHRPRPLRFTRKLPAGA